MLFFGLLFLLLGGVAAMLGFSGIAGVTTQYSWALCLAVGIVFLVIHIARDREPQDT